MGAADDATPNENTLKSWRMATRKHLIERRTAASAARRAQWSERIDRHLEAALPEVRGLVVGFCWPYRAEHDPRAIVLRLLAKGSRAALPVIVARRMPLEFREWREAAEMEDGAYGIPIPKHGARTTPDLVLLPANGFDEQGFRLGYGAGYFDRTLASLPGRPTVFGISFELGRLPTIHPQAHDIPLDYIVTEEGAFKRAGGELIRV